MQLSPRVIVPRCFSTTQSIMMPNDIKKANYKSLVRPQLEYATTVWDPATKTGINKVQAAHRRTARFCQNDYRRTSSVTSMIQNLGWEDLQYSRKQCKTTMMYRIVNNLIDIPNEKKLIHSGTSSICYETRFLLSYCFVNAYKSSFFSSAIHLWNSLPVSAVTAPSLDAAVQSSKPDKMFNPVFICTKSLPSHMCT